MKAAHTRFIMNEVSVGNGAGVYYQDGSTEFSACTFTLNKAQAVGGGIFTEKADVSVKNNCAFNGNTASQDSGGAIGIISGGLVAADSDFSQNTCGASGGAIINCDGACEIENCTFNSNTAAMTGGAVFDNTSILTVKNCKFNANYAALGGVLGIGTGEIRIYNSELTGNSSGIAAGAVYANYGNIYAEDSKFTGNKSYDTGGVFYSDRGSVGLVRCTVERNSANANGGVFAILFGSITLTECDIESNESGMGGAVAYTLSKNVLTFADTNLKKNKAALDGGVVYGFAGTIKLSGCKIQDNTAENGNGGAFAARFASYDVEKCEFAGNRCGALGSALHGNEMNIRDSSFSANYAGEDGGAIYVTAGLELSNVKFDENRAENGSVVFADTLVDVICDKETRQSLESNEKPAGNTEVLPEPEQTPAIPVSIYIGGGVLVAAILAAVLLIMCKRKKHKVAN